jgi:nucleotide-binding universal stress UspA family protein
MVMDTRSATRPVVVGVDGSAVSAAVLQWAVDEALARRSPLCVVHALDQPHSAAFVRANPVFVGEERRAAEEVLDTAVEHARSIAPDLDVRSVLEVGPPAVVLLRQAAAADLVVLGSRGRGGFSCLLLGSTSLHVYAPGDVVVLRPPPDSPASATSAGPSRGRIVVGTDGSPSSGCALRFAFSRARHRGLGVTALRAWRSPAIYVDVPSSRKWEQAEKDVQALLSENLASWREQYPEVDVVGKTVLGNAGSALVEESVGAELLVVGSRGHGGFDGLLLGSVSHTALHHAHCPVAVARR